MRKDIRCTASSIPNNADREYFYNISQPCAGQKEGFMNSRNKGAAGERELANILKGYGYDTRRGQQYCGANGDADVVGLPGVHIECKRVEKLNLYDAMEQSKRDAKDGEIPVVMHRKNRREWLVTIRLSDFMSMFKRIFKEWR